jgi:hypothetical protein
LGRFPHSKPADPRDSDADTEDAGMHGGGGLVGWWAGINVGGVLVGWYACWWWAGGLVFMLVVDWWASMCGMLVGK